MPNNWRTVRVFISSTFRDMHEEREELVKRVFPRLRKLCDQRGVVWSEVDLRWGIPDEQKAEGRVLPICLAEIRNCRPYFIGLLGERYGWMPDEVPQELIEREPWLAEHLDRSVTELEILHGVLNDPGMADHAFFYFRNPGFIDALPPGVQKDFRELPSEEEIKRLGQQEAERRAVARRHKLANLKDRIRASGLPVRENYPDPRSLGEAVLQDMVSVIDQLYPEGSQPNPLDREGAEHEAFAASRARCYIRRQEEFSRLDAHAGSKGPPLIVLGQPGSGKSALVANWALAYRASHSNTPVLMHFIGASPFSSDWTVMLRRIMGEFKRHFNIGMEIPDRSDDLRLAFATSLHMTSAKGRVVLVIDALNQLEERNGALDLVWLPPVIPANVRLVLSTVPGRSLDVLKKRGWPMLDIAPLAEGERQILISQYMAQYSKVLSSADANRISRASQSANPLYLRLLLDELRVFGDHLTLSQRIDHYLAASSIEGLYDKVLARYEEDYERDRPALVRDAMSALWAARRGLSETELLHLLGSGGQSMPVAYWSMLSLASDESLLMRSGLIGFRNGFLRQAICRRYLPTAEAQRASHLRLADYFASGDINARKVDELPWQIAQAKEWQRLHSLLADVRFFRACWQNDKRQVKSYWAQVEEHSNLRMIEAYRPVLNDPCQYHDCVWEVEELLRDMAHSDAALLLNSYLLDLYQRNNDLENFEGVLNNQGVILGALGDADGAMARFKEHERICRALGLKNSLQANLGNQAVLLRMRGDLDIAMELLKEQEYLCRHLGYKHGLGVSLVNQACILGDRGNTAKAMELLKEQESISRELGELEALQAGLGDQAGILYRCGAPEHAMELLEEQEGICRGLGDRRGLANSLGNQALIAKARGDLQTAMALLEKQEGICGDLGDRRGLASSLGNQALIAKARGDLQTAMALLEKQEGICRDLGHKPGLVSCLGNQANILYSLRNLDTAMRLHKEEEQLCREMGLRDGLQTSLGNQAVILRAQGDSEGALALFRQQECICREIGSMQGLVMSMTNQAILLSDDLNQLGEGMRLATEAYELVTSHDLTELSAKVRSTLDSMRRDIA